MSHAELTPGAPALSGPDQQFNYAQLRLHVARLAAALRARGVAPGQRVAVRLQNSAAFVTVALACLWLGAAFVPVSAEDPVSRAERTLSDCQPSLLVTSQAPAPGEPEGGDVAGPGPLPAGPFAVTSYEELAALGAALPVDDGDVPAADPGQTAYIIYTSGTTGRAKGVCIPRSALAWAVRQVVAGLGYGTSTRSLAVSAFHFDGSYGNLFATLAGGGLLVVPRRSDLLFLRPFFEAVLEHRITHCTMSPSYLRLLMASRHRARLAGSSLRALGLGGEQVAGDDLERLWAVLPQLQVFNLYGPTECTIEVTSFPLTADMAHGHVPLGRPSAGTGFHLVEGDRLVESPGQVGELYISGPQLMSGYWGDPALTSAVMVELLPGTTCYRTGDLAYFDDRGLYYFAGRADDVVKRNGVRISLQEVASALQGAPGVDSATCALFRREGRAAIAAFVVPAGPGRAVTTGRAGGAPGPDALAPGTLLESARLVLPANMLPDEVVVVDGLPLSSSGKVDRRELLRRAGLEPATEG